MTKKNILPLRYTCQPKPNERAIALQTTGNIHFVAAGHYATETFGVQKIGELVAQRFGIDHQFIDVPNPV